jgi:hypothetical protein
MGRSSLNARRFGNLEPLLIRQANYGGDKPVPSRDGKYLTASLDFEFGPKPPRQQRTSDSLNRSIAAFTTLTCVYSHLIIEIHTFIASPALFFCTPLSSLVPKMKELLDSDRVNYLVWRFVSLTPSLTPLGKLDLAECEVNLLTRDLAHMAGFYWNQVCDIGTFSIAMVCVASVVCLKTDRGAAAFLCSRLSGNSCQVPEGVAYPGTSPAL